MFRGQSKTTTLIHTLICISGTLAPPLLDPAHPDYAHSMDVIFATYWFFPAKTEVLLPEDQACIDEKLKKETIRFNPSSKLLFKYLLRKSAENVL